MVKYLDQDRDVASAKHAVDTKALLRESKALLEAFIGSNDWDRVRENIQYSLDRTERYQDGADENILRAWQEVRSQIETGAIAIDSWAGYRPHDACGLAEKNFWLSLTQPSQENEPSQLWVDPQTGEPLLWRKTEGEETALGLRALTTANGLHLPAGTLYDVHDSFSDASPKGVIERTQTEVFDYENVAIRALRFSAFMISDVGITERRDTTGSIDEFREMVDSLVYEWKPYSRISRIFSRRAK